MSEIRLATFEQEGFVSGYGLMFENGMILKTQGQDMVWGGKEKSDKAKANFWEVVELLKQHGFEVKEG